MGESLAFFVLEFTTTLLTNFYAWSIRYMQFFIISFTKWRAIKTITSFSKYSAFTVYRHDLWKCSSALFTNHMIIAAYIGSNIKSLHNTYIES